jgi:hypothetical protein
MQFEMEALEKERQKLLLQVQQAEVQRQAAVGQLQTYRRMNAALQTQVDSATVASVAGLALSESLSDRDASPGRNTRSTATSSSLPPLPPPSPVKPVAKASPQASPMASPRAIEEAVQNSGMCMCAIIPLCIVTPR